MKSDPKRPRLLVIDGIILGILIVTVVGLWLTASGLKQQPLVMPNVSAAAANPSAQAVATNVAVAAVRAAGAPDEPDF